MAGGQAGVTGGQAGVTGGQGGVVGGATGGGDGGAVESAEAGSWLEMERAGGA